MCHLQQHILDCSQNTWLCFEPCRMLLTNIPHTCSVSKAERPEMTNKRYFYVEEIMGHAKGICFVQKGTYRD